MKTHVFTLARIALLGLGAWFAVGGSPPADPADAAVGSAGPVTVTVAPTVGLGSGQEVAIHAEAPAGVLIYELAVHVCQPNSGVNTNYEWGFQGPVCPNIALIDGDLVKNAEFANGVPAADLNGFRVGTGNVKWADERGYPHTITCGPGFPCDLVVKVQLTGDTRFYTAPLCYGDGCGPEPGPPAPAASPDEQAAGNGGGGAGATASTTPTAPGATDGSDTKGAKADRDGEDSSAGRSSGDGDDEQSGTSGPSRPIRVFAAGMVGAACGARLVQIWSKARRSSGRP